jgi:hypothetical protein
MTEKPDEQLSRVPAPKQVWQSPTYRKLKVKESELSLRPAGADLSVYS